MKVRRQIKVIGAIAAVAFLCMQFFTPAIPTGQTGNIVLANVPSEVNNILQKSCFDCHSDNPQLKWFDKIAPASWLVASHIQKARQGLNFSNWKQMTRTEQHAKLWESVNHIMAGAMPLKSYTLLHPGAKISVTDLNILKKYVTGLAPRAAMDTAKINALAEQLKNTDGPATGKPYQQLPVDLNGIAFIPDYKNWTPISTTERLDNGTLRIIFGNDIAIKAIRERKTNPWPDGTILAKAAWEQLTGKNGNITTGAFKQVEYMIKDNQKYRSAGGWGWARFKTPQLKPYGATKAFTNECVGCHRPMKNNDFVFTAPLSTAK